MSERSCLQSCGGPGSEHLILSGSDPGGESRPLDEEAVSSGEGEQVERPYGPFLTGNQTERFANFISS